MLLHIQKKKKFFSFHNINPLSNFYILARYFKALNEFPLTRTKTQ